MSFAGSFVEEWKKLPRGGKIAVIGIFVLVAGIGFYEWYKSRNTSTGTTSDTSGTASGYGSQFPTVPGGNTGNVPVIPFGYSPVYDPSGNLVGWQQSGSSGSTGTTGTGTTPPTFSLPSGTPTNFRFDKLGTNMIDGVLAIWYGPQGKGHQAVQNLFPTGTTFRETNNQLFYTLPGGTETLFPYAIAARPTTQRKGTPTPPKKAGSGGGAMRGDNGGGKGGGQMSFDRQVYGRYHVNEDGTMSYKKYVS